MFEVDVCCFGGLCGEVDFDFIGFGQIGFWLLSWVDILCEQYLVGWFIDQYVCLFVYVFVNIVIVDMVFCMVFEYCFGDWDSKQIVFVRFEVVELCGEYGECMFDWGVDDNVVVDGIGLWVCYVLFFLELMSCVQLVRVCVQNWLRLVCNVVRFVGLSWQMWCVFVGWLYISLVVLSILRCCDIVGWLMGRLWVNLLMVSGLCVSCFMMVW